MSPPFHSVDGSSRWLSLFILCMIVSGWLPGGTVSAQRYEIPARTRLQWDLFNTSYYDFHTPPNPLRNQSEPVTILNSHSVSDALSRISFIDGFLTVLGLQVIWWEDWRLEWNPEKYGDIEEIWVTGISGDAQVMWVPDIFVRPRFDPMETSYELSNVQIFANGTCKWQRLSTTSYYCSFDAIGDFPFDRQVCSIYMGTDDNAVLTAASGTLKFDDDDLDYAEFHISAVHVSTRRYYDFPNTGLYIEVDIERSAESYWVRIIVPGLIVTYLSFGAFLLSPKAGERVGLGITCLLSFVAINFILNDFIPLTPEPVWMDGFILTSFCFTAASCMESIIVIHFYAKTSNMRLKNTLYGGALGDIWGEGKEHKKALLKTSKIPHARSQATSNMKSMASMRDDEDDSNSGSGSGNRDLEMDMLESQDGDEDGDATSFSASKRHDKFLNMLLVEVADSASLKLALASQDSTLHKRAEAIALQKYLYLVRFRLVSEWIDMASLVLFTGGYTTAILILFLA
eukprot:TRINITY_DN982_c0_g1_i4.p1 TRINITY_DN982_c0_g1~~TRINITY_DN982_c0_g1_i4.p1  ORF type:complete len:513 (+),score=103.00 TRINITY_DN982_c0_g1_i4:346-1884(+)